MALTNIPVLTLWGSALASINAMFAERYNSTGWSAHTDTLRTEGSPLQLVADGKVDLTNNNGSVIDTYKPSDIVTNYDGTVITGREGDAINLTLSFALKPTTNNDTKITVVPDIGGAIGEIEDYARDQTFSRGVNVEQRYLSSFNAYTLNTWEANGARLKIVSDYAVDIYNIRYLITNVHRNT